MLCAAAFETALGMTAATPAAHGVISSTLVLPAKAVIVSYIFQVGSQTQFERTIDSDSNTPSSSAPRHAFNSQLCDAYALQTGIAGTAHPAVP
jgi:hypothetical protein